MGVKPMGYQIKKIAENPWSLLGALGSRGMLNWLPDKMYLKIKYRGKFGKKMNLHNPNSFNEKLQWLKLHDRNPKYTIFVDKYAVKKYVEDKIGKKYIIPTLGVWNRFEDINFELLPNQFVLKCTHDCDSLIICKNKGTLNMRAAKKKLNRALRKNYFYCGREWPYKNVHPRIIAEEYMVDESLKELKDYKVFNFGGKSKFIQVDFNRFHNHTRNIYDLNWNLVCVNYWLDFLNDKTKSVKKPEVFDEMIKLAEVLSEKMPFVRTDFYVINNKLYFGELTFYPGAGFSAFVPDGWDQKLGDMIELGIQEAVIHEE